MQRAHRLPALHRVANALVKLDADGGIDRVFFLLPAAAEDHAGHAKLFALDRSNISVPSGSTYRASAARARAVRDRPRRPRRRLAAPQSHGIFRALARRQSIPRRVSSPRPGTSRVRPGKTSRRQVPGKARAIPRARPRQAPRSTPRPPSRCPALRPSGWFMSVMSATTFLPMRWPVSTSNSARFAASSDRLHKRARTGFHVQHQRVDALGQLLAHDGSADQCGAFHRAGHVAQRIDFLVGRSNFGRLPDQGAPARLQHAAELGKGQIDVEIRGWIPACRGCRRCAPGRAR